MQRLSDNNLRRLRGQAAQPAPALWSRCSLRRRIPSAPTALFSFAEVGERPAYKKGDEVRIGSIRGVGPMGLGTWSWGNRFLFNYSEDRDPELQRVFNRALSRGVNLFDSADSYGTGRLNGKSELLLGHFTREYPGSERTRSNVHIATKFAAYPWRVTPGSIVAACRGSLRRLGMDQLSLGQLHWSASKYAPLQELALRAGIAECYELGLVRAVGVSNYGPRELAKIHSYLANRGVPLASAQVQFSLLSYGAQQQELLEMCRELNVALISYSPLGLGLLTGKYTESRLPPGPRGLLFSRLLRETRPLLSTLAAVAATRRKSQSQVALNWCMQQGTIPIPGANTLTQMEENLGALGWRLSKSEVEELNSAVRQCKGAMVQNIFQTS